MEDHDEKKLKHLEFVQVAAIYIAVCFSSLYECAKENSGPLRPGVQTVEGTVKTVIGPVYEKFHDVPFELLKFLDRKVHIQRHALSSPAVSYICLMVKTFSFWLNMVEYELAGGRVIKGGGQTRAVTGEAGR